MAIDPKFDREAAAQKQNESKTLWVAISGLVLTFAGAFTALGLFNKNEKAGNAGLIGGISAAVVGLGTIIYAALRGKSDTKNLIDLEARKSAADLTQTLKEEGVNMTPEQQASVEKREYAKSKKEWSDRIKAQETAAAAAYYSSSQNYP